MTSFSPRQMDFPSSIQQLSCGDKKSIIQINLKLGFYKISVVDRLRDL